MQHAITYVYLYCDVPTLLHQCQPTAIRRSILASTFFALVGTLTKPSCKHFENQPLSSLCNSHLFTLELEQIGDVHWHFFNFRMIEAFNVFKSPLVIIGNEVNRNSFTTESTTTTNPVQRTNRFCRNKRMILIQWVPFGDL